uniref:Uncharacterized protein n=1 Tax=uncultured prokaryote TaxID=198431 RepID=A0A0H5Q6G2_9ZZZZ|nr:hypothetical protein [uncultured prokaryote]
MFRIRVIWTGVPGTPYYTNLYFNGMVQADVDPVALSVSTFLDSIADHVTASLTATFDPEVPVIDPGTGEVTGYLVNNESAVPMDGPTLALPPGTQALARLRTNTVSRGRRIQGHFFIPGPFEADNEAQGVPTAEYINDLGGALATLVDLGDGQLVVWSKSSFVAAPVVSSSISPNWSSLRTRRIQG